MQQFNSIASLPEPKGSERSILHKWIGSTALGGGCRFLGRDLGDFKHFQPSVYDIKYQKDLAILSDNHGEDDLFTKFLKGPLLTVFHWIWSRQRVRSFLLPSRTIADSVPFFSRHRYLSTQRILQLVITKACCITTMIVVWK